MSETGQGRDRGKGIDMGADLTRFELVSCLRTKVSVSSGQFLSLQYVEIPVFVGESSDYGACQLKKRRMILTV